MKWTNEPPTEPGWYWWRRRAAETPKIMLVTALDRVYEMRSVGFYEPPSSIGGEWYGPLEYPK